MHSIADPITVRITLDSYYLVLTTITSFGLEQFDIENQKQNTY